MTACIRCLAGSALLVGAAVVAAVSLGPVHASARSAVETVAFMVWGLEHGAGAKRVSESLWEAEGRNGERSSFTIQRLTDCVFRVSSHVQPAGALNGLEFDYLLNFAAVHDYSAWLANERDQRIIVKVEGERWYSKTVRSKATGRVVYNISDGNVDAYMAGGGSVERLENAFAHFRSAFCRGRDPPQR